MNGKDENTKPPKNLTQRDLLWMVYSEIKAQKTGLKDLRFWIRIGILALIGVNVADYIRLPIA